MIQGRGCARLPSRSFPCPGGAPPPPGPPEPQALRKAAADAAGLRCPNSNFRPCAPLRARSRVPPLRPPRPMGRAASEPSVHDACRRWNVHSCWKERELFDPSAARSPFAPDQCVRLEGDDVRAGPDPDVHCPRRILHSRSAQGVGQALGRPARDRREALRGQRRQAARPEPPAPGLDHHRDRRGGRDAVRAF